jgi:hypothetical protein
VGGEGSGRSRQEAQEDQGSPGGPGVNLIKLFFLFTALFTNVRNKAVRLSFASLSSLV